MDRPPPKPAEPRARSISTARLPAIELEATRHVVPESERYEREFILGVFRQQTEEIVGRIAELEFRTDRRLLELERAQVEESKTRVAVQELTGKVTVMLDRERLQDQDIGALSARVQAAVRPTVAAEAATEGQLAGHVAGQRVGKHWAGLGVAVSVVAVACMQYCQKQVERGLFDEPKAAPAAEKRP